MLLNTKWSVNSHIRTEYRNVRAFALHENSSNTEFFLVHIFLFGLSTDIYLVNVHIHSFEPEKNPNYNTFHAVDDCPTIPYLIYTCENSDQIKPSSLDDSMRCATCVFTIMSYYYGHIYGFLSI